MRHYEPVHFKREEYLPSNVSSLIVMDPRILWTMDQLRGYFAKPILVNNWHTGGKLSQRGFRNDPKLGAPLSQHRFGRACDFDIAGVTAEEFREAARAGKLDIPLTYITRIEDGVRWCHVDCAPIPGTTIAFFSKKGV